MTKFSQCATIVSKHYILTIYQAKAIQKSFQCDIADGSRRTDCTSYIRIFNAFNYQ